MKLLNSGWRGAIAILAVGISAPSGAATLMGLGAASCATALDPRKETERAGWVWGFWTGMNAAENGVVGSTTDPQGVLEEVELLCRQIPSWTLAQASYSTFGKLKSERR